MNVLFIGATAVDLTQRIVLGILILIKGLWFERVTASRIDRYESSLRARVVPCAEVIQPRLNVPFFEGELSPDLYLPGFQFILAILELV